MALERLQDALTDCIISILLAAGIAGLHRQHTHKQNGAHLAGADDERTRGAASPGRGTRCVAAGSRAASVPGLAAPGLGAQATPACTMGR